MNNWRNLGSACYESPDARYMAQKGKAGWAVRVNDEDAWLGKTFSTLEEAQKWAENDNEEDA